MSTKVCPSTRILRWLPGLAAGLLAIATQAVQAATPPAAAAWPVAGRQGLVGIVIVPTAQAADKAAYEGQIASLCDPERTCFLNFYTNSRGVAVAVPVPDEIADEATATFRRSSKNGVEVFKWSCRMKLSSQDCF